MYYHRVFLIESRTKLCAEVKAILNFMGCEVVSCSPTYVSSDAALNCEAIFACIDEQEASEILQLVKPYCHLPLVLVAIASKAEPLLEHHWGNFSPMVLSWPTNIHNLIGCLDQVSSCEAKKESSRLPELFRSLIGNSSAIQQTRKLVKQVAISDTTVLILGESGTGKEVVARNLHYFSARRNRPFIPVNCGAIPADLLESELFGHEKGAFTGALSSRQGRFELAEGGTLFLDEIGDMPLAMQVKLLRVLQERTFERVGSNKTLQCDVRIIAATHRKLEEEIRQNRFREDLYYRLNVFPIQVPALRQRLEDIPLLVDDLSMRLRTERRGHLRFTPAALQMLQNYLWPGNVRELANLVERLVILYPNQIVDVPDLPESIRQYPVVSSQFPVEQDARSIRAGAWNAQPLMTLPEDGLDLRKHLNNLEYELIRQALERCNGVVAHAANRLRMRRTTLVEKLRKYGFRGEETLTSTLTGW